MKSESRTFLEGIFEGKPEELYVLLWTLRDKISHWFQNVEEAIQFAESKCQQDLYVGVGFSGEDYGAHNRCVSKQIVGIVGLWADLDLKSDAHDKDKLPATVEEALALLPAEFPPTFIILTGNGVHAWWLFREPLIFLNVEDRQDAASLAYRWQSLLRLKAAARGWALDRLSDLARVLRVPGTHNCKDPQNPKPVRFQSRTDVRYNPSDFLEFLDAHGIPSEEERARTAQTRELGSSGSSFTIDPSATVPDETLNAWLEDQKFSLTWARRRDDLKDQSQSGYDMALANFGARMGMSKQQIVDMIGHHRRIHGQQQRTRQDYFQRTIRKAFESMTDVPPSVPSPPEMRTPEIETKRALLWEQISAILGIRILRIVKVDGQDPTYRVELETAMVILPSIEHLVTQRRFQMKIASGANHLVPKMQAGRWNTLVRMMLAGLRVEDGGDEADAVGAARIHVDTYLRESRFIDANAELEHQTRHMPSLYDDRITICANQLRQHMNKCGGEHYPIKDVTAMLSAVGAISVRPKDTKLRDQSRWLLPAQLFPPGDYLPHGPEEADA